ncbi:MAG: hypothetical protein V2G42_06345 [bacterium JZ-2024 1]
MKSPVRKETARQPRRSPPASKSAQSWEAEYRRRRHLFAKFARPRILALARSLHRPDIRARYLTQCSRAAFSVLYECGAYHPSLVRTQAGWSTTVPSDPMWLQSHPITFSSAVYFAAAEIALEGPPLAHLPEPVVPRTFGDVLVFHHIHEEIRAHPTSSEWRPHLVSPLTELLYPDLSSPSCLHYDLLFYEPAFGFIAHGISREWLNIMDALLDGDPTVTLAVLQNLATSMCAFRSIIPRDGFLYFLPFLRFYSDLFLWYSEDAVLGAISRTVDSWRKTRQAKLETSQIALSAVAGIFAPAASTSGWVSFSDIADECLETPVAYRDPPMRAFLEACSGFARVEGSVIQAYQRFARTFT